MNLNPKKILIAILIFAFFVRVLGINYGLPLQVVSDEPPFILGALKMIELKTMLPRTHLTEFNSVLYYPPYISYLYLPFYVVSLGLDYLFYDSGRESFANYIGSDFSDFFLIARMVNILFGIISVWLVYKTAKNIFESEDAALWSAFFMATDLLHIMVSMVSRQWLFVSFFFLLVLCFLTDRSRPIEKRYFYASVSAGIGIGASVITVVCVFLIGLYFLLFEEYRLKDLFKRKFFYASLFAFLLLAYLPFLIYPSSIGFGGKVTLFQSKNFVDLITSPIFFFQRYFLSNPLIAVSFVAGLSALFINKKKYFWLFFAFIFLFSIIFYLFFRFEDRFVAPLTPIFAIISGFGILSFSTSSYKWRYALFAVILFQVLLSSRLGYLAFANDSRQNMRTYIEKNVPENSKIITNVRLMRISSNKEGIEEQMKIDPGSIRQAERSELYFGKNPGYRSFHALNLDFVGNGFNYDLAQYVRGNSYEYAVLASGEELFGLRVLELGQNSNFSIAETHLSKNIMELFDIEMLGPRVTLYKLR